MNIPDMVEEMEPEELGTPITEEMLNTFSGYADPFWYQRRRNKRYHKALNSKWSLPTNPGTQPDIEIRWYYGESLVEQKRLARLSKVRGSQSYDRVF